jgi:hypothetical protein
VEGKRDAYEIALAKEKKRTAATEYETRKTERGAVLSMRRGNSRKGE